MNAAAGCNVNLDHMKPRYSWVVAALCAPRLLPALDLTPLHGFRELEGFKIPIVCFTDGSRKVSYQPPAQWRISGSGDSLQLSAGTREQAVLQFRVCPRPPMADGAGEDFERWARALLPGDATDIVRQAEATGQFTLGAQPSRELTFSYRASARGFQSSVAWVELGDRERLAVIVTARTPDFKAVHDEAIASLFSWNWSE